MGFFGTKKSEHEADSLASFCSNTNTHELCVYRYQPPKSHPATMIRTAHNAKIIKLQTLFLFGILLIFLVTFYLRFFMLSVSPAQQVGNCQSQHIVFDWWEFAYQCKKCSSSYELALNGSSCQLT